jgi:hypothetical protein
MRGQHVVVGGDHSPFGVFPSSRFARNFPFSRILAPPPPPSPGRPGSIPAPPPRRSRASPASRGRPCTSRPRKSPTAPSPRSASQDGRCGTPCPQPRPSPHRRPSRISRPPAHDVSGVEPVGHLSRSPCRNKARPRPHRSVIPQALHRPADPFGEPVVAGEDVVQTLAQQKVKDLRKPRSSPQRGCRESRHGHRSASMSLDVEEAAGQARRLHRRNGFGREPGDDRPAGSMKPFWLPVTATSTPHSSIRNVHRPDRGHPVHEQHRSMPRRIHRTPDTAAMSDFTPVAVSLCVASTALILRAPCRRQDLLESPPASIPSPQGVSTISTSSPWRWQRSIQRWREHPEPRRPAPCHRGKRVGDRRFPAPGPGGGEEDDLAFRPSSAPSARLRERGLKDVGEGGRPVVQRRHVDRPCGANPGCSWGPE